MCPATRRHCRFANPARPATTRPGATGCRPGCRTVLHAPAPYDSETAQIRRVACPVTACSWETKPGHPDRAVSGRENVAASSTLVSSAAGRYATALFELAGEADALERTEADMEALGQALEASDDLRALLSTPIYTRDEQGRAMAAVVEAMGLSALVANLAGLMAAKGRLFMLGEVIGIFAALMAEHRGEVTAEVTAARALSEAQQAALASTLKAAIGREVKLSLTVDAEIIGGLVVKVGSKMIDTSIRSKLAALQNAMREVG
ncbi:MAG: F0F1 ATP synthase subunit delta [Proteobacteria bacterium]|nr:F0F1 ATP synthase subunit delta [Pseudomonadota bacterium]